MMWSEMLSVGVEGIDSQHKELLRRINILVEAIKHAECKFVIDGTLRFLEEYALAHFSEEESFMMRHSYPGFEQHKAQHAIFLQSLSVLKEQAASPREKGVSYDLSVETNKVVVDWILSHIVRVDGKLGEFLKGRDLSARKTF